MTPIGARQEIPVLAIAGNPNSGKTTLFNKLTGLRQKVGNYSGVTVERKEGEFEHSAGSVHLIDLPGVHSLSPQSEEQRIACDVLLSSRPELPAIDGVIVVIDSTSLEKSLYLALQVLRSGLPAAIVLNMADELSLRGGEIDSAVLSQMLGVPVLLISATQGVGLEALRKLLANWPTPGNTRSAIKKPATEVSEAMSIRAEAKRLARAATIKMPKESPWTDKIDRIVMDRLWGSLIFGGVVLAVFQSIFAGARPLMSGIDFLFSRLGDFVRQSSVLGSASSFVADGVIAGVGSVVVFLPQILIVFFFLALLEYSGYLARAALVMDKVMNKIGLQGKSFLPLISSYACAIPGIMATRTIENRRDRLATLFVAPFMTCSARLPVYALFISAFVPDRPLIGNLFGLRAMVLLSLYAVGFAAAMLTTRILKSTILVSDPLPFLIEIPPYRMPQWKSVFLLLWDRSKIFLRRAGTVILLANVFMWVLVSFPKSTPEATIQTSYAGRLGTILEPALKPIGFNWKIGIGLISSQIARELMVSTLATVYRVDSTRSDSHSLQESLQRDMTPLKAFSLLVFFALALQCTSTLAVVRRETGGWKIPIIMFIYMNGLAYLASLLIIQGGRLFGLS